jgi:hypothetical protein
MACGQLKEYGIRYDPCIGTPYVYAVMVLPSSAHAALALAHHHNFNVSGMLAESALVDRELGRVLWESDASTLSASLQLDRLGIFHVQSTILSLLLLVSIVSIFISKLLLLERLHVSGQVLTRYTVGRYLLVSIQFLLTRMPKPSMHFLAVVYALYLLESYCCRYVVLFKWVLLRENELLHSISGLNSLYMKICTIQHTKVSQTNNQQSERSGGIH